MPLPVFTITRRRLAAAALLAWFAAAPAAALAQAVPPPVRQGSDEAQLAQGSDLHEPHPMHDIGDALIRLPLAAVFGAALALRPRRRGTPTRTPAVVQTQIMLSVVGSVIMLIVGASLARAFGMVGAANLIRYRSKIDDPKDAVVMLCALAVGLASGVGLYALGAFSTAFMVAGLWVIESFEPTSQKAFLLTIKAGKETDEMRPRFERVLATYKLPFELRTTSDEEVCYEVQVPIELQTDEVSNRLLQLDPDGHIAVEWQEKKKK
jgi:uncharacterized membrane protein YhiD involved in acid resistance